MPRIKIAPVTAVTCDDDFSVIENAELQVEGNRLSYVGPAEQAPAFQADDTISGSNLVAMPGLVNTHTHAAMTLLRGYADDMALEPWLHTRIWPFEKHLQAADVYIGTLLAICEMLRGGTTCFADMYHFYENGLQAMLEGGIRACPGGVLLGFLPEPEKRIEKAIAFAREYSGAGDGRITPFLAPHSLYTCNRQQWQRMVQAGMRWNLPIHTHAAETRAEVERVQAEWGQTPVRALDAVGALEGPLLAAHCVYVDEEEIALMSPRQRGRSHFRVAHNPTSNLKLASGFAPVPRLLEEGIPIGLGPDGTASNNKLDMWQEMRLAALLHKATTGDPTAVSARQALLMATREGARCLNLEREVGSLQAGKKADLVLVDFDRPHLTPRHNVVSHLVYAARADDVRTVLVDGRILLRDGRLTELDEAQICHQAQAAAERLVVAAESNDK